ncbi:MAG: endonuclease [Oscillospiraceae bacterium]|nr:endonuclease [Oscillospiraceae bacterium]
MKQLCKRSLALLMVLVMVIGLLPAITVQTNAATYTYNWGTRGTVADEDDFTRSTAEEWYAAEGTSYEELSQLSGSATNSSVPSSALYRELRSLMTSAHSNKTSYDGTKTLFQYTDCQNGGGAISSFYSGKSIGPSWDGSWNREHTWPNSKGDNNGSGENDIFMLRPTSTSENSSRGNTAYGESGSYYNPNEESGGKYDLRGDVVRIIMFVYVRWQSIPSGSTGVLYGTDGVIENRDVMLKWMEEDPVDTWELGRNDACQSITGTRNVFVDYPELGFLLFGADVPDNYTSPSGQGNSVSYNITATSNNTSYGTVSLSGKTITATPETGYYASGYTVTSGSATVTQNGNTFTVNASSDCTIRINFAAKTSVTVNFYGATVSSQEGYAGESMSLPTVTAPEGFTFLGWTASKLSEDTTTKPTYYTGSFTPTASTTLYALYSYSEGGSGATEYVLTDLAAISDTDSVVVTMTTNAGTTYALTSANGSSSAPTAVAVTVADSKLSAEPADALKWNIVGDDSFIIYPEGNRSIWLYSTTDNNGIRVGTATTNTFVVDSQYGYLQNTSYNRYVGVYNNDNWRSYTSMHSNIAGQTLGFYVKGEAGTTYYTSDPVKCEHTNTTNTAAVAATCTTSGYTAGVYCNDCECYISGHEVIAALGHSYDSGKITTVPTCTANGVKTFTCSACGATETQSVAATGHSYDSGKITTPATCTTAGVKTFTCSACGGTKTESIAATGHNYVLSGTTYTCTGCGNSYDTWFIQFSVPAGVAAPEKIEYQDGGITLPSAGVPTGEYTYSFAGWATAPIEDTEEKPAFYQAGDTFTTTQTTTLYAVYTYVLPSEDGGNGDYVKVTEAPDDWSGEYVIVYESGSLIFDSSLSKLDATNNNKKVTITNGLITASEGDPCKFTIAAVDDGYSVQAVNGNYIGRTATSNGLNEGTTPYAHTITIDSSGNVKITSESGPYLNFNAATDQMRFRYYKSGQKPIQLYVKNGSAGTTCYTSLDAGECKHDEELAVEVLPTLTQQGYTQYVCADCGEELYIEDYVNAVDVKWNISLQDALSVQFAIDVHQSMADTLQVKVTFDGVTDTYTGACAPSVKVAAAQMADEITIEFTDGVETVTKTYTVKQYADELLADEKMSQYHQLVKEMLNYGAAAQTYFEYNTENLVNADITGVGTAEVPETADSELKVAGKAENVAFYGATLLFRNQIAVRYYFTVSDNIAEHSFTVNGIAYEPVEKDGYYYIEIGGILPQDLDDSITVLVDDTLSVSYSPMNYIVRMSQKGSGDLKALLKAMYNYHVEAKSTAAAL